MDPNLQNEDLQNEDLQNEGEEEAANVSVDAPTVDDAKEAKYYFWQNQAFILATRWTIWTFAFSGIPLIVLLLLSLIISGYNVFNEWPRIILECSLLFIGTSCASSTYLDYYYSQKYQYLEMRAHKWLNVCFWLLISVIAILYTTSSVLESSKKNVLNKIDNISFQTVCADEKTNTELNTIIKKQRDIISNDMGVEMKIFTLFNFILVLLCIVYSIFGKAILISQQTQNTELTP